MSEELIYLYRRKGQDAFASCDVDRFEEVSRAVQLFETKIAYSDADYAALEAECDTLRQQRDKLAEVLGDVEREHDLIRQMKNCEIQRCRGSFGIAVMSDPLALEWQALDKELQQFVDARRAILAPGTEQEVGK